MALEFHHVVQQAADLDEARPGDAVEREVPRRAVAGRAGME